MDRASVSPSSDCKKTKHVLTDLPPHMPVFFCQFCQKNHFSHHSHRLPPARRALMLERLPTLALKFEYCDDGSDCFVCCALFREGHPSQLKGDAFMSWMLPSAPLERTMPAAAVRTSRAARPLDFAAALASPPPVAESPRNPVKREFERGRCVVCVVAFALTAVRQGCGATARLRRRRRGFWSSLTSSRAHAMLRRARGSSRRPRFSS